VLAGIAGEHRIRESRGLGSEQQRIVLSKPDIAVPAFTSGRERERAGRRAGSVEDVERGVFAYRRPFVVVEAGAAQARLVEPKPEWPDQVQRTAGIGAEPYNVAGVRGDFRLIEDNVEHDPGSA